MVRIRISPGRLKDSDVLISFGLKSEEDIGGQTNRIIRTNRKLAIRKNMGKLFFINHFEDNWVH